LAKDKRITREEKLVIQRVIFGLFFTIQHLINLTTQKFQESNTKFTNQHDSYLALLKPKQWDEMK